MNYLVYLVMKGGDGDYGWFPLVCVVSHLVGDTFFKKMVLQGSFSKGNGSIHNLKFYIEPFHA